MGMGNYTLCLKYVHIWLHQSGTHTTVSYI